MSLCAVRMRERIDDLRGLSKVLPMELRRDARLMQVQDHTQYLISNPIRDHPTGILSMKPGTAKRSSQGMRFFTPDLYLQFNSSDEEEADEASETWENAIAEYHRHLIELGDRLPSSVQKLSELNLHDAELIGRHEETSPSIPIVPDAAWPPFIWSSVCILSLRQEREILSLIYILWDRVREEPALADWPFSPKGKHWLYDEIDLVEDGRPLFWHRILFSDGTLLRVPFVSAIVYRVPLLEQRPALKAKTR